MTISLPGADGNPSQFDLGPVVGVGGDARLSLRELPAGTYVLGVENSTGTRQVLVVKR